MTPKQKDVLSFIEEFSRSNSYAPSQWEIANHFGFSSLGTVQHYLKLLQEQGHLTKTWNGRRTTQITKKSEAFEIPLLGLVAAGLPIEALEVDENFSVPTNFMKTKKDYFCLRVEGNSMIDEQIRDKDIVLIRRESHCENGDIVVGVINGKATLKKFRKTKTHIELLPANADFKPIIVDEDQDFRIAGVFEGLFRFNR
jgi:repressor LexA